MFFFSQPDARTTGQRSTYDVPTSTFLSTSFDQGVHDGAFESMRRISEYFTAADGAILSPEDANKKYGLEGLTFSDPILEGQAQLLHDRKKKELFRGLILSQPKTFGQGAGVFGAAMIGSMLNPVDIGSAFLPIVGSAKAATAVKAGGGSALRTKMAGGLLTSSEALAARGLPHGKFTMAMIDGAASQAIVEVPLLVSNLQSQADYGVRDSLLNIAAGGVLSGGIRLGLEKAAKVYGRLTGATKDAMFVEGMNDIAAGEPITRLHKYVDIDEGAIRAEVEEAMGSFDPTAVRKKIEGEVDKKEIEDLLVERFASTHERIPRSELRPVIKLVREQLLGDEIEAAKKYFTDVAWGLAHGKKLQEISSAGVSQEFRDALKEAFRTNKITKVTVKPKPGELPKTRIEANNFFEEWEVRRVAQEMSRRQLYHRKVTNDAGTVSLDDLHRLQAKLELTVKKKVNKIRGSRVARLLAEAKTDHAKRSKQLFSEYREREIQKQIKEGHVRTPDQIKNGTREEIPTDTEINLITRDVEDLADNLLEEVKQLRADAERVRAEVAEAKASEVPLSKEEKIKQDAAKAREEADKPKKKFTPKQLAQKEAEADYLLDLAEELEEELEGIVTFQKSEIIDPADPDAPKQPVDLDPELREARKTYEQEVRDPGDQRPIDESQPRDKAKPLPDKPGKPKKEIVVPVPKTRAAADAYRKLLPCMKRNA